jgi:7,8-dihydropterin-6-yl-methyl-4-(beta-D-ribofuranosyl)aminobenzene 5'-phosphate synthase
MLSELKLTILCENRVTNPELIAEQGLAILVETPDDTVLFNTGQTDTIIHNAQALGINLSSIHSVVLSHGHFDMVGGLPYLLKKVRSLKIYCHPNLFNKKFHLTDKGRVEIGVRWEKSELEDLGAKFILKTHPIEIIKDIWISGEIPRLTAYEYIDETYQERVLESYIHDEIHDDMTLIINTSHGLIILLGCGHAGPVNSIKYAMRTTGINKVHVVMGGMHLHKAPEEKIESIVYHLIRLNPDFIIPLHCCGFRSINKLYNRLRDRILLFNVGDSFTLNYTK